MTTRYFHDPFDPDEARAAAAELAYPDRNDRNWDYIDDVTVTPRHGDTHVIGDRDSQPVESTAWMGDGNCLGRTEEMFIDANNYGGSNSPRYRAALANGIAICTGCPVRTQCADYADRNPPYDGIWAGVRWDRGRPHVTRKRPPKIAQNYTAPAFSLLTLIQASTWGDGKGAA